jgi:hypothetical protein
MNEMWLWSNGGIILTDKKTEILGENYLPAPVFPLG